MRYPSASCRSLYMPNPARITVLFPSGLHATPILGSGRNFALFTLKGESPMCGVESITPFVKKKFAARPCDSFHPEEDSPRKPRVTVSFGLRRIVSSANTAPKRDRQ